MERTRLEVGLCLVAASLAACAGPGDEAGQDQDLAPAVSWDLVQDSSHRVGTIEGFSGPEAVRYDPDQDVWFVSNFDGEGDARDANGFISRVSAETGQIEALRFAQGTAEHPLHAPRGMFLVGDTLWVADMDGVHGFHRRTGAWVAFVDLTPFEPGFLNDVAQGPDGALYVTDTGTSSVYRIAGRVASVALADSMLGNPNGITWDPTRGLFVLVPWDEGFRVNTWQVGQGPQGFGPASMRGRLDGIEPIDRRLLVASQSDSTILLMDAGVTTPLIHVGGRPADIGVDTRRRRIAVPYVDLNRVDIWHLPAR
ncbi:MAG: SMP-30/gluconolactonase/LRE family protein [Longimicrobiales bacterium]|nr:SMP-30/gluconolactonase/LRE family protein [Longimicrobiales bacterium]